MNHYPRTAPTTAPAEPFMVESRVPVGESRVTTHVVVPFFQALITMALIVADVLLWQWHPIAGTVGAVGLIVWGWRVLLGDRLLWKLETITGRDLDGDGDTGAPHPFVIQNKAAARSQINAAAEQTWRESRAAELVRFAAACATSGTSEAAQGISSKAQREKYVERRQALFDLGLAAWKNPAVPNSAWMLTLPPEQTAQFIQNYVN